MGVTGLDIHFGDTPNRASPGSMIFPFLCVLHFFRRSEGLTRTFLAFRGVFVENPRGRRNWLLRFLWKKKHYVSFGKVEVNFSDRSNLARNHPRQHKKVPRMLQIECPPRITENTPSYSHSSAPWVILQVKCACIDFWFILDASLSHPWFIVFHPWIIVFHPWFIHFYPFSPLIRP